MMFRRLLSSEASNIWFRKSTYRWFLPVQTRWKDNDQYLHINNAVYHAIFDSVINVYLIRMVGLDPTAGSMPRGYMVTNSCTFRGACRYPDVYLAGLAASKIGKSSVKYELCLFPMKTTSHDDSDNVPLLNLVTGHTIDCSQITRFADDGLVLGESVHVFVDPETQKPTPIPTDWKNKLKAIHVDH